MTLELADQVALVTGAGQGIGRASALALAEAGAHVVVADIAGPLADATTGAITSTQRRALAIQVDVGDLSNIDRMVRQALATFGEIDILVNNAGVTRRADIMELTEEHPRCRQGGLLPLGVRPYRHADRETHEPHCHAWRMDRKREVARSGVGVLVGFMVLSVA